MHIEIETLFQALSILNGIALGLFLVAELIARRRVASGEPRARPREDDPVAAWIAEVERGEREQWGR